MIGHPGKPRLTAYVIEGLTPGRGEAVRVLVAGIGAFRHYVARIACGKAATEQPIGELWAWQVESVARRRGCDLILMTANAFGDRLGLHRDYLCLPQWIYGAVPLDPEDIYEGRSYHRRRDLRLVRENNLEYSIVADEAALNDWYETMYTPLIRASHGAGALLMSRDAMLRQAADGECELVLISREGKALGGSLLVYDEAGAKVLSRGILDANRDYQRQGVGAAIYLFSFDYLYKKGFKSVDIGRVRPFLGDGGLHFKKKNGFCLTGHSGRGFLLKSCRASPAADEFFIENPLVHIAANGLRGLLAFPEGTLVDDKKFRKKLSYHELPGLEQLDIIELGADNVVGRTSIERARPLVA